MAESIVDSPYGPLNVQHPEGASHAEILEYAKKNFNPDTTMATAMPDAGRGLMTGMRKGTEQLVGLPGDLKDIAAQGVDYMAGTNTASKAMPRFPPTAQELGQMTTQAIGEPYKPTTDLGKATETIGEFIPGAAAFGATGGGSLAGNVFRYGVMPGGATALADKFLPDNPYKPYLTAGAGLAAGVVNPARVVTRLPVSETRQRMLDTLRQEGVTSLTAGQQTGNEALRYLESASSAVPLGGHRVTDIANEGQRQFTSATMRRAGTGPDALPEVLAANQKRLGNEFESLSARNNLKMDVPFANDIQQAADSYARVPPSQQKSIVEGYIRDIRDHAENGMIPGPYYQEMRSRLSRQSKALRNSDPTLSQTLGDMRDALDSGMRRSISPADREAWDTARKEYGAQKVIEKAASRAGEATAEGQITPPNLRNTVSAENRGAYARGQGQFADLARAGAAIMTPLPNSGTAQRANAFHVLNMINGLLAGLPAAAGARVVQSKIGQGYLANQLLSGSLLTPNSAARNAMLVELLQHPRNQDP